MGFSQMNLYFDVSHLSPLSNLIMSNQATINVGTIGHVAHGKSTIVKSISRVQTVRFKSELERNITIKLGYANAKIFVCPECPRPECYQAYGSGGEKVPYCKICRRALVSSSCFFFRLSRT